MRRCRRCHHRCRQIAGRCTCCMVLVMMILMRDQLRIIGCCRWLMRLIADWWCLQLQYWNASGCYGHRWRYGCGRVLIIVLLLMIIGSGQAICGCQVWGYAAGRYGRCTGHVISRQRCNVYWWRLLEETIVLGSSTFRLALLVQLKWQKENWV